jgi:hypothetical protein
MHGISGDLIEAVHPGERLAGQSVTFCFLWFMHVYTIGWSGGASGWAICHFLFCLVYVYLRHWGGPAERLLGPFVHLSSLSLAFQDA